MSHMAGMACAPGTAADQHPVRLASFLAEGGQKPFAGGGLHDRGYTITRSAPGTDRNVTASRSPTYSPSIWKATGRLARSVRHG